MLAVLSTAIALMCRGPLVIRPRPAIGLWKGLALAVFAGIAMINVSRYGDLMAIGLAAGGGFWWLRLRRSRLSQARAVALAVQQICAEIADDLEMGRVPDEAMVAAADRWPPLRPAGVAAEFHQDVAQALRQVAHLRGASGLRDVSAAWQVSGQMGSGLADALGGVASLLAARERRTRLIDSEMAAARATAMVVSGLPLLVLAMGSGLGANPWSFFVGGAGTVVAAVAGLLLFAGWAWLDWLMARAVR